MTPAGAVKQAISDAESLMSAYARDEAECRHQAEIVHDKQMRLARLQVELGEKLEGLRIALRRVSEQDADMLHAVTGQEPPV